MYADTVFEERYHTETVLPPTLFERFFEHSSS
jgi:hypothetical protein